VSWPRFADRAEAGRRLGERVAERLAARWPGHRALVLALPRGGVPVAAPVATALGAPLDVLVVRKVGVPGRAELAMGAVATGGVRVLDQTVAGRVGLPAEIMEQAFRRAEAELAERERSLRGDRPPPRIAGCVAVLVDDGMATGSSMRAAVTAVRTAGPAAVVVAVPVAPGDGVRAMRGIADEVICLRTPLRFIAVSQHYADFAQVSEAEVALLLAAAENGGGGTPGIPPPEQVPPA
jgi:predicted phosphoribosyltransferase